MKVKRLSGDYYCEVSSHTWDISGYSHDTVYNAFITMKQSGTDIIILNQTIPYDSISQGKEFIKPKHHGIFKIRVYRDSLFISQSGGGLGGGYGSTYRGLQE